MTSDYEIRLHDLLGFSRRRILIIAGSGLLFALVAIGWSFTVERVYRSEALVMPMERGGDSSRFSSMLGRLADLGAVTGLSVGSGGGREESVAILRSRALVERFIEKNDLLPVLFADKWDEAESGWAVDDPEEVPTIRDAYEKFENEVRSIYEDRDRGLITISIEWTDRQLAARWANAMIRFVNEMIRTRAIEESQLNIDYLRSELKRWNELELQRAIYDLIEAQLSQIMLANSTQEYAFRVIDPAVVSDPDQAVWPKKPLIAVLGLFLGIFVGIIISLVLEYRARTAPGR